MESQPVTVVVTVTSTCFISLDPWLLVTPISSSMPLTCFRFTQNCSANRVDYSMFSQISAQDVRLSSGSVGSWGGGGGVF